MTGSKLIKMERLAHTALEGGDYKTAISVFRELLREQPDYEHGLPHYHVASALEEIGDYHSAAAEYKKALSWEPNDPVKLGGYASFLYLHGDPSEAFEAYLKLAKTELRRSEVPTDIRRILFELASRMGLSKDKTKERIQREGIPL